MTSQPTSTPVAMGLAEAPLLSLHLTSDGAATVITVRGELDLDTAHVLTDCVEAVSGSGAARVVLDMANVTFLCAAGLRALLQARDLIIAAGGQLLLRDPSAQTRRILELTGTDRLLRLEPRLQASTAATNRSHVHPRMSDASNR